MSHVPPPQAPPSSKCVRLIPCAVGFQTAPVVMDPPQTSIVHAPKVADFGQQISDDDQHTMALVASLWEELVRKLRTKTNIRR